MSITSIILIYVMSIIISMFMLKKILHERNFVPDLIISIFLSWLLTSIFLYQVYSIIKNKLKVFINS